MERFTYTITWTEGKELIYLFKGSQKNMGVTCHLNHHCKERTVLVKP